MITAFLSSIAAQVMTPAIIVCPDNSQEADCVYKGGRGLREAVNDAQNNGRIIIREGRYVPDETSDVAHREISVRAFLVIQAKSLTIEGVGSVIIDGSEAGPMSFMMLESSGVAVSNISITNFAYQLPEDDIYDGHGIYAVSSNVRLAHVTISGISKMAVTGRENSQINAVDLRVLDSHVGIWLEEIAEAKIGDSVFIRGETVGICAYGNSRAQISTSLVFGYQDDGIFASDNAQIKGNELLVISNAPFGARASGNAKISLSGTIFSGNAERDGEEEQGKVSIF